MEKQTIRMSFLVNAKDLQQNINYIRGLMIMKYGKEPTIKDYYDFVRGAK